MAENILVLTHDLERGANSSTEVARRFGDIVGLVDTRMKPDDVRKVGSRIDEERAYGGALVSAFDEPLTVGSALAQLAGFADAIVVDRLDDWAVRLEAKYNPSEDDRIVAEILGVTTMMNADLAHLVFLSRPASGGSDRVAAVHARILAAMGPYLSETVEVRLG